MSDLETAIAWMKTESVFRNVTDIENALKIAIGAHAELEALRSALAEKDKRIADLEESLKIMADEYAKLESEKECQ